MELTTNERQGIIVWVYSLRHFKTLKRFGLIHYASRRMKYVVMYINQSDVEMTQKKLADLHFVRKVELSYRPFINLDFKDFFGKEKKTLIKKKLCLVRLFFN
ncbi:YlbG family protein [Carnobacterium viridans]|uniref:YlbG family protein n=1 Tax=Carnobacterium viridans TaxID=174587 RepID=UPI001CFF9257|nr:YlbG family protein [Carnobacterium viridans]UDE95600.1 YlbG family protein [Carnobacterium viridans]